MTGLEIALVTALIAGVFGCLGTIAGLFIYIGGRIDKLRDQLAETRAEIHTALVEHVAQHHT